MVLIQMTFETQGLLRQVFIDEEYGSLIVKSLL